MKKLFVVLVLLLVALLGGAYLIDPQVEVTRSVVIDAPPAAIHPWVEDLQRFDDWATFDDGDASLVYTWGDTTRGVGATRSWTSDVSGNGAQTITRSDPAAGVWMRLDMQGFEPATVSVTYAPAAGGGTEVTWTDAFDMGDNPIDRWFALAMEGMVGPMFEESLGNLKARVEAPQG